MKVVNAIAQILNVSENQIKLVDEWANVYFVKFHVGRPTFVSKKAVEKLMPLTWNLSVGKRQSKAWLAKLTGLCPKYVFTRKFVEGVVTKWNRKGAESFQFVITEPGLYQDSEGDYFEVRYVNDKLDFTRYMCRDEARTIIANIRIPSHA